MLFQCVPERCGFSGESLNAINSLSCCNAFNFFHVTLLYKPTALYVMENELSSGLLETLCYHQIKSMFPLLLKAEDRGRYSCYAFVGKGEITFWHSELEFNQSYKSLSVLLKGLDLN